MRGVEEKKLAGAVMLRHGFVIRIMTHQLPKTLKLDPDGSFVIAHRVTANIVTY